MDLWTNDWEGLFALLADPLNAVSWWDTSIVASPVTGVPALRNVDKGRAIVYDYRLHDEDTWAIDMWVVKGVESLDEHERWGIFETDEENLLSILVYFSEERRPTLTGYIRRSDVTSSAVEKIREEWRAARNDFAEPEEGTAIEDPPVTPLEEISSRLHQLQEELHIRGATLALHDAVPKLHLTRAGGSIPFQAEGFIQGYAFYFRFRGGRASLRIGGDDPVGNSLWGASFEYGDQYDGSLTMNQFSFLFSTLLTMTKESPGEYEFRAPVNYGYPTDIPELEAAHLFMRDYYEKLGYPLIAEDYEHTQRMLDSDNVGRETIYAYSEEEAREVLAERHSLDPKDWTLIHGDQRVFPDTAPIFAPLYPLPEPEWKWGEYTE